MESHNFNKDNLNTINHYSNTITNKSFKKGGLISILLLFITVTFYNPVNAQECCETSTQNINAANNYNSFTIKDFDWIESNEEIAIVLLQGENKDLNKLWEKEIDKELKTAKVFTKKYNLDSAHNDFLSIKKIFEIKTLPSAIVLSDMGSLLISTIDSNSSDSFKINNKIMVNSNKSCCSASSCGGEGTN